MTDRTAIETALRAANGKMDKAARILNVSRRTLQNRMRELGMSRAKAGRPKRRLYARRARTWGTVAVGTAALVGIGAIIAKSGGKPA